MRSAAQASLPAIKGGTPVFSEPFRFIKPSLPPSECVLSLYADCYASGVITNAKLVRQFEEQAAERLGVKHCVAVSSCTSGLILVLKALGLTGEVILPSFTFFATGHALLWNGLTPVFADCDPQTWVVDPREVAARITERTSAIVGVHLYGNPCDVDGLTEIAGRHHLKLVYDSAHAFGSACQGRPVGSFGDAEVFSLSPTKLLVAGEGGLVATNDAVLAQRLRAARNYGDLGAYDPQLLGLNARMPEFNAALAVAGLPFLDAKVARHNQVARHYTALLADTPGLGFQAVLQGNLSTYKDYSVLVYEDQFGMSRDELAEALRAENIETKKYFYPPLHKQALFRPVYEENPSPLQNTEFISDRVLSFPIYESLPDDTISKVAFAVRRLAR